MKIINRIKDYIDFKDISMNAFDISIGAANGYIGKLIKNNGSLGGDVIEKIVCIYTDINIEWLITGKGEMFRQPVAEKQSESDLIPYLEKQIAVKDIRIENLKEEIWELKKEIKDIKSKQPKVVYDNVAAEPKLELNLKPK